MKKNITGLYGFLMILFFVFACQSSYNSNGQNSKQNTKADSTENKTNSEEVSAVKTYQLSKKEFSRNTILNLLIEGTFDEETGYQKWKAPKGTLIPMGVDGYAYSKIDTILKFNRGSEEFQLAVIKSSQKNEAGGFEEFNAIQPCIGMALFSNKKDAWVLESFNPMVTLFGAMNMIPSMRIAEVGTNASAIIFTAEIHQDLGIEQWFLLEKNFPMFLENTYAQPTGEDLEKLLLKKVEIVKPKKKDNASEDNQFYDIKLITYEEEYDEKTDQTKEMIKSTEVYTPVYSDIKLKYSFELK